MSRTQKIKILFVKTYGYAPNQAFDVPIGILYLSAYLKKHLGNTIDISLIDLRIQDKKQQALKTKLLEFKPDIIGISTLAFEHKFLTDNIELIKTHAPSATIVIGGPYASSNYQKVLRENRIDYAIIGEGEKILCNFVDSYVRSEDLTTIKGVAYKKNGSVICNDKEEYIKNLDSLPVPDYSLIEFNDYWGNRLQFNGILSHKRHASVISSRACPYRCVYCHSMFGKTFRKRSPEHFLSELSFLYHTYGIREFHIIDDVFNLDRTRMHAILNGIIHSGMKLKLAFPNGLRGDILEKNDIKLLQQAGAYMLTFAIETGSGRMQRVIRKNLDINKVLENIDYAGNIGLITRGFFMLGFPGETVEEMKLTIKTALKSKLSMASFFIVVPFENTELFDMASRQIHIPPEDTLSSYQSSTSFYEKATGYDTGRLQKLAYFQFYTPLRLIRLFIKIPRKTYQFSKWISFAVDLLRL